MVDFPGVPIDHPERKKLTDAIRKIDEEALFRSPYIIRRLLPACKCIGGIYYAEGPRITDGGFSLIFDPEDGAWCHPLNDLFNQHGLVTLTSYVMGLGEHEAAQVVGRLAIDADTVMTAMLAVARRL